MRNRDGVGQLVQGGVSKREGAINLKIVWRLIFNVDVKNRALFLVRRCLLYG
jgi:hypothetical protein